MLATNAIRQAAINSWRPRSMLGSLPCPTLENQGGIGAAEAKGIGERVFDAGSTSDVGNVVEVALGIGRFKIDRGRQNLIAQCEHTDARFEAAGAAEQMAGHGLGGTDGNVFGAFAEDALEGAGFDDIAERRRSAMRVHIANIFGLELGVFDGGAHDAKRTIAIFCRLRNVKSIAGHSVSDDFSKDVGTALLCVFERFQNYDAGAFADDETVALRIKRAAGVRGIVIASGERFHAGKTANAHGRNSRFGTAAN